MNMVFCTLVFFLSCFMTTVQDAPVGEEERGETRVVTMKNDNHVSRRNYGFFLYRDFLR